MKSLPILFLLVPGLLSQNIGPLPMACFAKPIKLIPKSVIKIDPKEAKCLAVTIYGEARGESRQGMVAVAFTVLTRSVQRKTAICKVALSPMQYSIFNGNSALKLAAMSTHLDPIQKNVIDKENWYNSVKVAEEVLRKEVKDPTLGSTHYLSPVAMKSLGYAYPKWSYTFVKTVHIGNHVFFKQPLPKKSS